MCNEAGPTFLRACAEVLKPGGVLVANLFNNNPGSHARLRFAHYAVHVSRTATTHPPSAVVFHRTLCIASQYTCNSPSSDCLSFAYK